MFEDIIKRKKKEICKFCISTDIEVSKDILIVNGAFIRHRHLVRCYNCGEVYYSIMTKLRAVNV